MNSSKIFGFSHESTHNESIEWYTPSFIFQALGIQFDLDPCSPLSGPVSWVPAKQFYTVKDDGLAQDWFGNVFVNPPYGMETPRWLKKLADHDNGIALLFSRTDTRWFHEYAAKSSAILFIRKRVQFVRSDGFVGGGSGSGSMLIAFGEHNAHSLARSSLGLTMKNYE